MAKSFFIFYALSVVLGGGLILGGGDIFGGGVILHGGDILGGGVILGGGDILAGGHTLFTFNPIHNISAVQKFTDLFTAFSNILKGFVMQRKNANIMLFE